MSETSRSYSLNALASLVGGRLRPAARDATTAPAITGIAGVADAEAHQATWVSSEKYAGALATSRAGVVLVPTGFDTTPMPAIECNSVDEGVAKLLSVFAPPAAFPDPGVHPSACVHHSASLAGDVRIGPHVTIDAGASIGAGTILHAGVFIGAGAVVGDTCVLWPNVVVRDRCRLGNRVTVHANSTIGADGFGYYVNDGRHQKIPHIGTVIIEDDVEIGANSCIDRAKFAETVVGQGTKIDNLVQVAHNVRIGRHCIIAGQTGISGSVTVGDYAIFGGRAATADHVHIGAQAIVAASAGVHKDVPTKTMVSGMPAQEHHRWLREQGALRKLARMVEQVRELSARVEQLEESTHDQA